MDTIENEIQTLQKKFDALYEDLSKQNTLLLDQIISLRQENIALCKELSNQHQVLFNITNSFNGQNLSNHLTRLAGMQTAKFIVDNMNKVKSFSDKKTYLNYLLSQVSTAVGGGRIFRVWSLSRLYYEFYIFDITRQSYLRL